MRRFILFAILFSLFLLPVQAQDSLNLPSELYVLLNEGVVQRFGLGREGVARVTPESEFVLDFRVAPDANAIAYRTQAGLFISNLFDMGNVRQIEDERASLPNIRGKGETIAWSNNSDALAYTTAYGGRVYFFAENAFSDLLTPNLRHLLWSPQGRFLAAEDNQSVWWIFQRDGTVMNLRAAIPGANGGDWHTETQFMYAPIEGGVTILDLSAGNMQIQILNSTDMYYLPQALPDGNAVVFRGEATSARLQQLIFADDTVTAAEIASGDVDLTGARWSPGGYLLMAFQGGVLAQVDPISGNVFPLPISNASTYSWGPAYPPYAVNQPLPDSAYFLSSDLTGVQQVWRLPADGSAAQTITSETLDISEFALSFDGQKLAYVSNSSLWYYQLGDESAQELVQLGNSQNVTPAWGPDNTHIYYRDEQGDQKGIWRVALDGSKELFLADAEDAIYTNPNPAGGVAAMLVKRSDQLALVDTTTGSFNILNVTGTAHWQSGTELIVEGSSSELGSGLYTLDANSPTQPPKLIVPLLGNFQLLDYRVLAGGNIRMLVRNQTPGQVSVMDVGRDGSQPTVIASIGYMVDPHLSNDGSLVIAQRTPNGALLLANISSQLVYRLDVQPPVRNFVWH